jgi:hypothetical protein
MQYKTVFIIVVLLMIIYLISSFASDEGNDPRFVFSEKYRPPNAEYRYSFVDTNPMRRVGSFFDNCSPENMEDCKRNDPYKGLPKP